MMSGLLEVCVDSLVSARAAIAGGADRLELCNALAVGGLTPSPDLLVQIRRESSIPVRCLMRPRAGDFLYTPEEIQLMAMEIARLRDLGADGFVIGCLTPEGELDDSAMAPLLDAARGKGLTLHRCVDVSRDPVQTYQAAGRLGLDTVLTSGGAANCSAGKETIAAMLALQDAGKGPQVLVGAGVNADVITAFRQELSGARAFHMSGKENREGVPMGIPGLDEWHISQTSAHAVRLARQALDASSPIGY